MATVTNPNTAPTFIVRDGKLTTTFETGSTERVMDLALQQDGKILLAGTSNGRFALARYNVDGTLDATFSGDGKVTAQFIDQVSNAVITVLPDGKIFVTASYIDSVTMARFLPNGDVDTTFGINGALKAAKNSAYLFDFTPLANGKVLSVGTNYGVTNDFAISRYNADGSFDSSFGSYGTAIIDVGTNDFSPKILVQADGKVLIEGFDTIGSINTPSTHSLVRLNTDGTLDKSFSGDGKVLLTDGTNYLYEADGFALQADGKVLVAGSAVTSVDGIRVEFIRYNADGSLDKTFNGTGIAMLPTKGDRPYDVDAIAVQKDGKILSVSTITSSDQASHIVVFRLLANGALDETFGNGGKAEALFPDTVPGYHVHPKDLVVQPDGKILVYGDDGSGGSDFALLRLNANGSIDTTFSPPSNTLDATPVFTESSPWTNPVVLDGDVQITDSELAATGNYNGATLTLIRHEGPNGDDVFSAKSGGTLSMLSNGAYFSIDNVTIGTVTTNAAGTLKLTFGSNATEALVNKTMQQIAYANLSDAPPGTVRIDWTFSDGNTGAQGTGGALAATGSTTVTIIGVNDAPQFVKPLADKTLTSGAPFSYVIPQDTFSDPDHDVLGYSVVMSDGTAPPPWLSFDLATRTLSGTPAVTGNTTLSLLVVAKDNGGLKAFAPLNLKIDAPTSHIDGTSGADNLVGTTGNDILQGFVGNDTLDGKAGADMLAGGDGNDLYYVDNVGDVVSEIAGGGADMVYTTIASYQLAPNVEYGRILSSGQADLMGNELANALYAGSGNNILDGGLGIDIVSYAYATAGVTVTLGTTQAQDTEGSGIDTLRNIENLAGSRFDDNLLGNQANNILNGGAGADFMAGGNGSDLYAVDNAGDIVRETNADATVGGIDTVESSIGFTLGANVENLTLTGTGAINGTGNVLANKLLGNSGNNVLNGGAGIDTMAGGLGNDTYYVDNAGDVVSEAPGAGTDTVISTVTRTLGDNQENLTLAGTAAINGTGNALANNIIGNAAANTLTGGLGKDVLEGGGGSDVFVFNASTETGVTSAAWDVINDFVRGQDKLDLRGIDANTATTVNDAFTTFIAGTAAFTAAGQLKFVNGVLYGNTDGDADAEFAIQLTGITQLTTADVVL